MNPITTLSSIIENIVFCDDTLVQAFNPDVPGWIDVGPPLANDSEATWPCLRIDGLTQMAGKHQLYSAFVKLWSQDMSAEFFDLAECLKRGLQSCSQVLCEEYYHRPDTGLNCAMFPVQFYC